MKKKGFTLIELLAVIVILAIIALIAVPIVLGIINDSKNSSEKENINLYKSAVNNAIARKQLSEISFNPDTCNVKDKGVLECFANNETIGTIKVEMSGQLPNDGIIRFEDNKISEIEDLKIKDNYYNLLTSGKIIIGKKPTDPGLYDEDYNLVASWDELQNYGLNVSRNFNSYTDNGTMYKVLQTNENLKQGKLMILPNTITKIGRSAFQNCEGLETIIIPDSVRTIKYGAFQNCKDLIEIKFTKNSQLTDIEFHAFAECTNLKKLVIPPMLTDIGNAAFYGCVNLSNIEVRKENLKYEDRGSNAIIEKTTNRLVLGCKNTVIPDGVISIGMTAFGGCTNLKKIIIPNSVINIEDEAFSYSGLTEIIIPSNMKKIGEWSFGYCENLKKIIFDKTAGWYATEDLESSTGESVNVTNPELNAVNFKGSWGGLYLKNNS